MHKILNARKRKSWCVCVCVHILVLSFLFLFCGFFFLLRQGHMPGPEFILQARMTWTLTLLNAETTSLCHHIHVCGARNGDKWFVHARKPLYRLSHILSPVCADTGAHMSAGTGTCVCRRRGTFVCWCRGTRVCRYRNTEESLRHHSFSADHFVGFICLIF